MPRTSDKAQLIMDYVNQFIQEKGYSPSVREIGAAVGVEKQRRSPFRRSRQRRRWKSGITAPGVQ